MITRIHVNQHRIKQDAKNGTRQACLTVKAYNQNRKATEAVIRDANGDEIARIIYRPDKPLACGARCWIETQNQVEVIT